MYETRFLFNIAIALTAALIGGLIARRVGLPVLIGYLLAGVAVGPHTPGITAQEGIVHSVANLGVVLLMFTVGAHFSVDQLRQFRKTAIISGGLQIISTILMGVVIGVLLGWGIYGGIFLGCALSLSSTAVMMKLLEERGEQKSEHGVAMLAVLIAQDLSVVLMAPLLAAGDKIKGVGDAASLGGALLAGGAALALILALAMRGAPRFLRRVTKLESNELFLLAGLCISLAAALAAEKAGLGMAIGAFLAGVVISETDYSQQMLIQVRPLRDVFAALFFVSIGMLLDPHFFAVHWLKIVIVTAAVVIGKAALATFSLWVSVKKIRTAIVAGVGLAQIGEFSFVLASMGSARNLIPAEISGVILSSALVTLLLAPFMLNAASLWAKSAGK